MAHRVLGLGLLVCWTCFSATQGPTTVTGENSRFSIKATLYKDSGEAEAVLGHKLEAGIVVLNVEITPKNGEAFEIWRDDFLLRSDKDGQKSEPYDPGQIASDTVITVVYTQEGGGVAQQEQGPVWGGMGGQMPGRLPGAPGGVGNTGTVEAATDARVEKDPGKTNNPLLRTLRERILPEEEITETTSGLLYYPLDGKHKTKRIWLHYVGKEGGKIDLQFRKK